MQLQIERVAVPVIGGVCLAATPHGLVRVHLGDEMPRFTRELREAFPDAEFRDGGAVVRAAARAVKAYLAGGPDPDVEVVFLEDGFQARVWREIRKIPRGEVRSYGRIAKALRKPMAARAVGQACGRNPVPLVVPCHRVISSDGSIGGFTGDLTHKRRLLELEGVHIASSS
jgi:O-6-methylguanine DNA methyltransferase